MLVLIVPIRMDGIIQFLEGGAVWHDSRSLMVHQNGI